MNARMMMDSGWMDGRWIDDGCIMDGWMACMKDPLAEKALADPTKRSPAILGSFVLDTYEHAPCRSPHPLINLLCATPLDSCVVHCPP